MTRTRFAFSGSAAPAALAVLAAATLSAHCSDEKGWDAEGRIYTTVEASVLRSAASLVDRPVDLGDAVYAASFEVPGGFPRQPWSDVRAFVEFPPEVRLGDGDEPVFCVEYAPTAELVLRNCATLTTASVGAAGAGGAAAAGAIEAAGDAGAAGAAGVAGAPVTPVAPVADTNLSGGQVFHYWLAELPRASVALDVRRVTFEVHRPEAAPSLESSLWKLRIVDGSCDQALAFRANAAACDPAAGENCSWTSDNVVEIDDVTCRMRRRLD